MPKEGAKKEEKKIDYVDVEYFPSGDMYEALTDVAETLVAGIARYRDRAKEKPDEETLMEFVAHMVYSGMMGHEKFVKNTVQLWVYQMIEKDPTKIKFEDDWTHCYFNVPYFKDKYLKNENIVPPAPPVKSKSKLDHDAMKDALNFE
jgi:hypothetical protein